MYWASRGESSLPIVVNTLCHSSSSRSAPDGTAPKGILLPYLLPSWVGNNDGWWTQWVSILLQHCQSTKHLPTFKTSAAFLLGTFLNLSSLTALSAPESTRDVWRERLPSLVLYETWEVHSFLIERTSCGMLYLASGATRMVPQKKVLIATVSNPGAGIYYLW